MRNHPNSKLNWELVERMRKRYAEGIPQSQLSRDYGVSENTVGKIVRRTAWVNPPQRLPIDASIPSTPELDQQAKESEVRTLTSLKDFLQKE